MRQRSKSVHVENPTKFINNNEEDDSSNDDIDYDSRSENHDPNIYDIKTESGIWSTEDDLCLVVKVSEQISCKDNCPYEKSISSINWSSVKCKGIKGKKLQSRFSEIVDSCRTWRTLPEILAEAHKKLIKSLPEIQKPQTSFGLFIRDKKDLVMAENQSTTYLENASSVFKTLDEEQKEEYRKQAAEIKEKYNAEISKFKLNMKTKRMEKKNDTPFTLFWNFNKLHGKMSFADSRKLYSEMDHKEKLKWILRFLGVKHGDMLTVEQIQKAKKMGREEILIINEYEGKPKKLSAYNLFMKEFLNKKRINSDLPWGQIFKLGVEKWKKLSIAKKSKYENLAKQVKEMYEPAYEKFVNSLPETRKAYELATRKKDFILSENNSTKKPKKIKQESNFQSLDTLDSPSIHTTPKSKKKLNGTVSIPNDVFSSIVVETPSKVTKNKKTNKPSIPKKPTNQKNVEREQIVKREVDETENNGLNSKKFKKEPKKKINSSTILLSPKLKKNKSAEDSFFEEIENVDAHSTQIKPKSNKKRKISLNESQSDSNTPIATPKKQKLFEKCDSKLNEIEKINLTKPPNTVFKYYKKEIYKGPMSNSKESFNALSAKEKAAIKLKYSKAKTKYLTNFESYLKSLTQNEIYSFAQEMQNKEQSGDSDSSDSS